jgi:hypothetical protein
MLIKIDDEHYVNPLHVSAIRVAQDHVVLSLINKVNYTINGVFDELLELLSENLVKLNSHNYLNILYVSNVEIDYDFSTIKISLINNSCYHITPDLDESLDILLNKIMEQLTCKNEK